MIFYIISIILVAYSFINYKKSFIMFLGFRLFLNQNITIISMAGIPTLTLDMVLVWLFFIEFLIRYKNEVTFKGFFFIIPMMLTLISCFFSGILGIASFSEEIAYVIKFIGDTLIITLLVFWNIKSRADFITFTKVLTFVIFISVVYGFYEASILENPLIEYEQTLNYDSSKVVDYIYADVGRGYRIQSIFYHSIGAGINWALYVGLMIIRYVKFNDKLNIIEIMVSICCIPCIILTKCRSAYLFLIIILLAGILSFNKRALKTVFISLILILIGIPFLSDYSDLFLTMFSSDVAGSFSGSSFQLRSQQFETAFDLLKNRPIFGYGSKAMSYLDSTYVNKLYGLESVWLNEIVKYGLFGVVITIFEMIFCIVYLPFKLRKKWLVFVGLAYWLTYSISSVPGMYIWLYYIIYFYGSNIELYNSKYEKDSVLNNNYSLFSLKN